MGDLIEGASGNAYVIYKDETNTNLKSRSLTGTNWGTEGTIRTIEGTTDPELHLPIHGVYYDAAGTERITIAYRHADKINTVIIDNDGVPDTADVASDNNIKLLNINTSISNLAVDSANDKVHLIYVRDTDDDIYIDSNTNDGGCGTDTAEISLTIIART